MPGDPGDPGEPLRVLIANERFDRVEWIQRIVTGLGHDVVMATTDVEAVVALTEASRPDVALVGLGEDSHHALELIGRIVRQAACPVIVMLVGEDEAFVNEAAKRGVFAYLANGATENLGSALAIVLRRFAEYHNLENAFTRRATIERAKGILMERHHTTEQAAFDQLRDHARASGRRLADISQAVCDSHNLLPANAAPSDPA